MITDNSPNRRVKRLASVMLANFTRRTILNEIEAIIFDSVEQGSHENLRVSEAKTFHLARCEFNFVSNFKPWSEVTKMFLRGLPFPACGFHQSLDELIFSRNEVNHATLIMTHQSEATNPSD